MNSLGETGIIEKSQATTGGCLNFKKEGWSKQMVKRGDKIVVGGNMDPSFHYGTSFHIDTLLTRTAEGTLDHLININE